MVYGDGHDDPGLHLRQRRRRGEPRRGRDAPATVSGGVYNIAPGQSSSLLELLGILGRLIGREPDPMFVDPRPGDVPRACADASAAARDLGWSAPVSLADGLASYVDWLRPDRADRGTPRRARRRTGRPAGSARSTSGSTAATGRRSRSTSPLCWAISRPFCSQWIVSVQRARSRPCSSPCPRPRTGRRRSAATSTRPSSPSRRPGAARRCSRGSAGSEVARGVR